MIIPMRCVTCGTPLANKYTFYNTKVREHRDASSGGGPRKKEKQEDADEDGKTFEGRLLDEMGIVRPCCRRHMLTHVDLIHVI